MSLQKKKAKLVKRKRNKDKIPKKGKRSET